MQRIQLLTVTLLLSVVSTANAYTPSSREVRDMVARGVRYLENVRPSDMGRNCLVAMALYKADKPTSHQKIQIALDQIREGTADLKAIQNVHRTYDQACALIFLCEINNTAYQKSMQSLATALMNWQKQNGAWGYENEPIGDTSQTVFAALALWEARRKQIDVPQEVFVKALNWLIRTQDISGGYAYKGEDSEQADGRRIHQPNPYPCATAAGLGATYVCANALGIEASIGLGPRSVDDDIPPALQFVGVVDSDGSLVSGVTRGINRVLMLRALTDGNRWFDDHYSIAPTNWFYAPNPWNYYYLYTLERFRSFQANAENIRDKEGESPSWYDQGVEYLMRKQDKKSGMFGGAEADNSRLAGPQVSTSLALMFLVRSTQTMIGVTEQLVASRRLDQNTGELKLDPIGRMATESVTLSVDKFLELINKGTEDDDEKLLSDRLRLVFIGDAKSRREQAARVRALVTHKKSQVRIMVVRAIARNRDLDNVPALIFALSDPDKHVIRAARDGLRFISRKFDGFQMPDIVKPKSKDVRKAQTKWKAWYDSIRPDADFEAFTLLSP